MFIGHKYDVNAPGLFVGVLAYQILFRMSAQWSDGRFPARRSMSNAQKAEFDRRLVTAVCAAMAVAGCAPILEDYEHDGQVGPWRVPNQLYFFLHCACGALASDFTFAAIYSNWTGLALATASLLQLLRLLAALVCFGLVAYRGVLGYWAALLMVWECQLTLALNFHYVVSIKPTTGDGTRVSPKSSAKVLTLAVATALVLGALTYPVLMCDGSSSPMAEAERVRHMEAEVLESYGMAALSPDQTAALQAAATQEETTALMAEFREAAERGAPQAQGTTASGTIAPWAPWLHRQAECAAAATAIPWSTPQLHRPDTAESDLQTLHLCGCCALLMLLARCMGVAMVLLGWDSAHRPSQHNTPPMMTSADFDSFAVVAPATAESTTPATAAAVATVVSLAVTATGTKLKESAGKFAPVVPDAPTLTAGDTVSVLAEGADKKGVAWCRVRVRRHGSTGCEGWVPRSALAAGTPGAQS